MDAFDAQVKYRLEKAVQDLLVDLRAYTGAKHQVKVVIEASVAGRHYDAVKISPSLEGDILVTGHEINRQGTAL